MHYKQKENENVLQWFLLPLLLGSDSKKKWGIESPRRNENLKTNSKTSLKFSTSCEKQEDHMSFNT